MKPSSFFPNSPIKAEGVAMIEHKKRVIFYPMQLRDFVRDHGAELPIGIPVAYDTIKP